MSARNVIQDTAATVRRLAAQKGVTPLQVFEEELLPILRRQFHGGRRPGAEISTGELRKAFLQ